ncbi:SMP-30/gluconolactonase/LRE family protein [Halogranum rubrum]|nr:SMP-30/gluconolactonase/LRE family protein [Halogranum rubrum]
MVRIERVADVHAETGEGALWHPTERRLYWLDIPRGRLYRYDPETDTNEVAHETADGSAVGGFTVETDGALLLFGAGGRIQRWDPATGEVSTVLEGIAAESESRFNDVIAAPDGSVFCGTMPSEDRLGSLYRLGTDGSIQTVVDDVDIANGMGFSPDERTFYFTESNARRIYAFDYDTASGELSSRRTAVETPVDEGVPDGMTVDEAGALWSARWGGGVAVRYDPSGEVLDSVDFPARKVSCVTFGGPEYDDLYVTTALGDGRRATEGDGAGALFRVPGVTPGGTPPSLSAVASRDEAR